MNLIAVFGTIALSVYAPPEIVLHVSQWQRTCSALSSSVASHSVWPQSQTPW